MASRPKESTDKFPRLNSVRAMMGLPPLLDAYGTTGEEPEKQNRRAAQ
jgi:hypothetical protein